MKDNKLMSICVLTLSVSIVFGSIWIGSAIRNNANNPTKYSYNKALMTEIETAEYLSLSLDKFQRLVSQNDMQRSQLESYETYSFIHHITIDGEKYFNKEHIDRWVESSSLNIRKYKTNGE